MRSPGLTHRDPRANELLDGFDFNQQLQLYSAAFASDMEGGLTQIQQPFSYPKFLNLGILNREIRVRRRLSSSDCDLDARIFRGNSTFILAIVLKGT